MAQSEQTSTMAGNVRLPEDVFDVCDDGSSRSKLTPQNRVQCCTLYQWFLHVEAVGGLCMPTNEWSKGREPLATGQLSNGFPDHEQTFNMSSDKQTLPVIVLLCSPNKSPFVLLVSCMWAGTCLKTFILQTITFISCLLTSQTMVNSSLKVRGAIIT